VQKCYYLIFASVQIKVFIIIFLSILRDFIFSLLNLLKSAICTEAKNNNKKNKTKSNQSSLEDNKANALASLMLAATQLDKFVLLSYAQSLLAQKNKKKNKRRSTMFTNSGLTLDETERRLLDKPILLRSTLSRNHSYAIVLTPNYNLNVACCECSCHPKDNTAANFV
jgi:hypothetical protein